MSQAQQQSSAPRSGRGQRTSSGQERKKRGGGLRAAADLFAQYQIEDKGGYITQEFQDFGYRMAVELDDLKHKSLYMRLAKKESRGILERALSFVKDSNARSKARLFMWKLKELKKDDAEAEIGGGAAEGVETGGIKTEGVKTESVESVESVESAQMTAGLGSVQATGPKNNQKESQ